MPSTSKKQHDLMEAIEHNPAAAQRTGVPVSVAKEFVSGDKGRTFDHAAHHAALKKAARDMPIDPTPRGGKRRY